MYSISAPAHGFATVDAFWQVTTRVEGQQGPNVEESNVSVSQARNFFLLGSACCVFVLSLTTKLLLQEAGQEEESSDEDIPLLGGMKLTRSQVIPGVVISPPGLCPTVTQILNTPLSFRPQRSFMRLNLRMQSSSKPVLQLLG